MYVTSNYLFSYKTVEEKYGKSSLNNLMFLFVFVLYSKVMQKHPVGDIFNYYFDGLF